MAAPGKYTINLLSTQRESLLATFTPAAPLTATNSHIQYRVTGTDAWTTLFIPNANTSIRISSLGGGVNYQVRVRGINTGDSPTSYGEWSSIISQTTIAMSNGTRLVEWNPKGTLAGPIVNNTGTAGSPDPTEFDLDVSMLGGGTLSNQIRNGWDVWQASGGDTGLRIATFPPVANIPQPCTIYMCFVPFFVDGTFRWLMRGRNDEIQIRMSNVGFSATSNGVGIFNLGTIVVSAQLYVLEFVMDGLSSSLRVQDDLGQDVNNSANINFTGDVAPESLAWDIPTSAGLSGNAQYMESFVVGGIGTAAERNSYMENLLLKYSTNTTGGAGHVLLPSFRSAAGAITLDNTTSVGAASYVPPVPPVGGSAAKRSLSINIGINI